MLIIATVIINIAITIQVYLIFILDEFIISYSPIFFN